MEERLDNRGDEPSTTQPSQQETLFFILAKIDMAKNCHSKWENFCGHLRSYDKSFHSIRGIFEEEMGISGFWILLRWQNSSS